ncbi:hypothetical protein BpHYR1_052393 [Brachionus plicatilis]|uniref:Uncharacterized protein n=1 Tax=Brachionus plicatilis TaxID=10195 RepID=A0A3M7SWU2_BRAPC|nr:hypothetical protein BpHYR1_052393 [Brachionus plicatilis]
MPNISSNRMDLFMMAFGEDISHTNAVKKCKTKILLLPSLLKSGKCHMVEFRCCGTCIEKQRFPVLGQTNYFAHLAEIVFA